MYQHFRRAVYGTIKLYNNYILNSELFVWCPYFKELINCTATEGCTIIKIWLLRSFVLNLFVIDVIVFCNGLTCTCTYHSVLPMYC